MRNRRAFDLNLFNDTSHNPSYASLTNNFEFANDLKDYCIPVNTYFPPQGVLDELHEKIPLALKYYPGSNRSISNYIAAFSGIENPENIIAGNGSTEIISWLNSVFIKESLFVPVPSFGRWVEEPKALGIEVHTVQYKDDHQQQLTRRDYVNAVIDSGARNAVICNPNNPTGSIFSRLDILWILDKLQHLDNIIIDESFIDFSAEIPPSVKNDIDQFKNAWVLKSLGKNLGLHGLRMGYAISCKENITRMSKHLPYWNINGITEMLLSLIRCKHEEYHASRRRTIADTHYLASEFSELEGFTVYPTHANFIFVRLDDAYDGMDLRNRLLQKHACFIRNCENKLGSTPQYFRIATRQRADVDHLISAIKMELAEITDCSMPNQNPAPSKRYISEAPLPPEPQNKQDSHKKAHQVLAI